MKKLSLGLIIPLIIGCTTENKLELELKDIKQYQKTEKEYIKKIDEVERVIDSLKYKIDSLDYK